MWFWNRREIYCGYSLKTFSEIRDTLAYADLRYDYKIFNNAAGNRVKFGNYGQNKDFDRQYYLYVHRKDYEQAKYLLNKS